jgi:hypothetical protein
MRHSNDRTVASGIAVGALAFAALVRRGDRPLLLQKKGTG